MFALGRKRVALVCNNFLPKEDTMLLWHLIKLMQPCFVFLRPIYFRWEWVLSTDADGAVDVPSERFLPFTADCNRLSVFHMTSRLTDDDDISITAQRKVLDCIFKGYSQWVKDFHNILRNNDKLYKFKIKSVIKSVFWSCPYKLAAACRPFLSSSAVLLCHTDSVSQLWNKMYFTRWRRPIM